MPRNHVKPYRRTEVRQRIEEMIRRGDLWGQRLSGQRELATELDVCRRTLEQALAEMEADGLIERRHGSGTFVSKRPPAAGRSRRTVRLAVIAETHWEAAPGWNYYGEMIRSVLGLAPRLRAQCEILALDRPEEQARLEDSRELRRYAGFISVVVLDRGLLSRLAALGRGPVALLDHQIRDLPITCVVDGSFEGARAVTKHLLGLGHRRIAFLDHHNRAESNPEKFAGYAAALAEAGIRVDERIVVVPSPELDWLDPEGERVVEAVDSAVARLLALDDPPTALFAFDDFRAIPAIASLERRGLRPGRDFAVAGFGDSAIRRGVCAWLTSSRIYARQMGQEALRAALDGEKPGGGRTVIVPTRLFVRKSSCPPPAVRKEASHA